MLWETINGIRRLVNRVPRIMSLISTVLALLLGFLVFHLVQGLDPIDALYLTIVTIYADTYAPGLPYCTYGLRAPVSCVLYVPEAQGSLPPGPTLCTYRGTRTSLGCAVRTVYRGTPGHNQYRRLR